MVAFVAAVLLISASPGPAMALILRRASLQGLGVAAATILGLEAGLYVWALVAAAGFATLVAASEVAFIVLKVVGAIVLVGLGLKALVAARQAHRAPPVDEAEPAAASRAKAFAEGVVVQLANPKAAVFMVAFYPQFIPADRPLFATTAALAVVQVVLETAFYLTLAAGLARAGRWFRTPRVRARLEAVSGTVLIGLGVRVATTQR